MLTEPQPTSDPFDTIESDYNEIKIERERRAEEEANKKPQIQQKGFDITIMIKFFNRLYFDVIVIFLVLWYATNYFMGVRTNRKIAARIATHLNESLKDHFLMLGNKNKDSDNGTGIDLDHSDQFEYYWNGSDFVYYMEVWIHLKRRHDLFTMIFRNLCWVEKDKLWVEVPIKTKFKIPLELMIIQNKEIKLAFEKLEHLQKLIYQMKVPQLKPSSLCLFAEHSDIPPELFDLELYESIKGLEKYIVSLHITDQQWYNNYDLWMKVQISIITQRDYLDIIYQILELLMKIAKKISTDFIIPQNAMKVIKEHRK